MLNINQFRKYIVQPALRDLIMYSENAEELLIFTCAVESLGGTYLVQDKGPALGIYQMEPRTYNDIWQNYIKGKGSLRLILTSSFDAGFQPDETRLIHDLRLATAMCRLHYARVSEALPQAGDLDGIWEYYKKYYNSIQGSAIKEQSILKYHAFINTH